MPRVLWCNLDPQWPFARMLHDHCLDWVAREDVWVWDARDPPEAMQVPWDDWPRLLAPETLQDALDELPPAPADGRLLAVHLPSVLGADDPARAFLDTVVRHVAAHNAWTLILSLPERAELGPYQRELSEGRLGARLIARLGDDPRRRLQSQRLLIEMMLRPELVEDLARPADPALCDVTLETEHRQPVHDQPAVQWNAALPNLLRQIDALERPIASPDDQHQSLVDAALDGVDNLRSKSAIPGTTRAAPVLEICAPRYLDPSFADRLRAVAVDFLGQLDQEMNTRWQALDAWRAEFMADCDRQNERIDADLAKLGATDLGFSDQGRERLDTWRGRLADELRKTVAGSEKLAGDISRDVRRPGPEEGDGYVRHRFDEDDAFDEAVEAAIGVSARLLRRSVIVSGSLLLTLASAVPVLAMRLPLWLDGGPRPAGGLPPGIRDYLATPPLWLFDLGWVLLPGVVLLAGGWMAAGRRRRDLAAALQEVQRAAEGLWQRHARVLDHMARYVGHTAAMRRLLRLQAHLQRLDQGVRAGRATLAAMKRELQRQQRDYGAIGVPEHDRGPSSQTELTAAIGQGIDPFDWLIALVREVLSPGTSRTLTIDDDRISRMVGELDTPYLQGEATLRLQKASEP